MNVAKHLPADSATVAAFERVGFALANVLAFRQTLCGEIGGGVRQCSVRSTIVPHEVEISNCESGSRSA